MYANAYDILLLLPLDINGVSTTQRWQLWSLLFATVKSMKNEFSCHDALSESSRKVAEKWYIVFKILKYQT